MIIQSTKLELYSFKQEYKTLLIFLHKIIWNRATMNGTVMFLFEVNQIWLEPAWNWKVLLLHISLCLSAAKRFQQITFLLAIYFNPYHCCRQYKLPNGPILYSGRARVLVLQYISYLSPCFTVQTSTLRFPGPFNITIGVANPVITLSYVLCTFYSTESAVCTLYLYNGITTHL